MIFKIVRKNMIRSLTKLQVNFIPIIPIICNTVSICNFITKSICTSFIIFIMVYIYILIIEYIILFNLIMFL